MNDGRKCFEILDSYWCMLEKVGLVDSCSGNVEEDNAEILATFTDENGNLIHIELSMSNEDFAENMEI